MRDITVLTAEFAACGCAVDFRKTCSCPKAESMNVVLCPLHKAAASLLVALTDIADQADRGVAYAKREHTLEQQIRYLVMKLYHCADSAHDAIAAIAEAKGK